MTKQDRFKNAPASQNRGIGRYVFDNPRMPLETEADKQAFRATYPERLKNYEPQIVID